MRVAYTDPAWALRPDGEIDRGLAGVEAEVFCEEISFDLGIRRAGRFVLSGRELGEYLSGADAVVVYRCQVTPGVLAAAGPACKVVARQGVGLDNLDLPALREAGVWAFHVPDYCGDEVSTHALALALGLERGVCAQDQLIRSGQWSIHGGRIPRRTASLTAGIVGFGRIGRATSRKLGVFYSQVLAYDPYVPGDLMASHGVAECRSLTELFSRCDLVVLHPELTAETEGLVGSAVLSHCKPGALLVNAARGRLVDPGAVLDALGSGRLGGFASDVFSPEDPNDSAAGRELLTRPDVIVSAHRAFLSADSEVSVRRRVAQGIRQVLTTGQPPAFGRVA